MVEQQRTEKSIFLAAVEIDSDAERGAYVEQACAGNPQLYAEVEALLCAHATPQPLLDAPPTPGPTSDQQITEGSGTVIGPYKLIEPIGEGGMGTVWMAQQTEPVKRLVALKLIKAGMDSKQVIARFEAERQALALMDHPHIARVLDGGTTSAGRPYFVMDLVKGVPITRYCDEHRLTPRQRLELFLPVCQAVQHAHQKGIIHRDLKPSNVLVALYDGKPVPKVIDFGVAKAAGQSLTDKTLVTGFGAIVGTLEYMSPEQAEINQLDIDTRSDIYSLGVLLYELLAGSPPFSRKDLERAGMLEMLRVIREQEPSKPSTKLSTAVGLPTLAENRGTEPAKLTRLVRGELDWIVMKALEKDRNRRYETANGFALDVQRYLADEPVQACPPSAGYRLRKFVRRNKGGLAVATLVLFFLLLFGSSAGWVVRDREARDQEMARERVARQEKLEQEVARALEDVQTWYERANDSEARAALRRAAGLLTTGEASQDLRERVGQWRTDLEFVQRLEEIRSISMRDRASYVVRVNNAYTGVFRDLGIDVDALPVAEAARRVRARLIWQRLADALDDWGMIRQDMFIVKLCSQEARQRLHEIARVADPDPLRGRVRLAVEKWDAEACAQLAREPGVIELRPATLRLLVMVLYWSGPQPRERSTDLLTRAQSQRPGEFWTNFGCARHFQDMDPPQWQEAIRYYSMALAIRPKDPRTHDSLGIAYDAVGKLDEAVACFRKAIELDPNYFPGHNNLGTALAKQGKVDEAIAHVKKAIELDPKLVMPHTNLGSALLDQGKLDEAIACYRKAIELDPNYVTARHGLGIALARQGKLDEAIACYRKAIELEPKYAPAHYNLGVDLHDQGKPDEAIACYRKAIELEPKHASAHYSLGVALAGEKKPDQAMASYKKAIELDPKLALAHNGLGNALHDQGKPAEAIACYRRAIDIDPKCALAHYNLGLSLHDQGKLAEAIACFQKAIDIDPRFAQAHNNLGGILTMKGQFDAAIACFRKAIELDPKHAPAHENLALALNNLAWGLASNPDAKPHDPGKAVGLAEEAVRLAPRAGPFWNTLGVAHYRAGRWKEALASLEKAVELGRGGDASDWFFLAMAQWQLGRKDDARQWYEKAVQWMDRNAQGNEELRRFRSEAEELLEIKKK
jgi:tetratricopeptide (TPR) repeat protein/serine/threonine protein kinase